MGRPEEERRKGFGFIKVQRPGQQFSVMLGRSHRFLGIYQYFVELKGAFARAFFSLAKTNCHRSYGKLLTFSHSNEKC